MKDYYFEARKICFRSNDLKSDKPTLIFIHGISGSSSAWALYEEKFEKDYPVITFDLRGHGKSPKPKEYGDYAIKKFSEDLEALIVFLGIKKYILISHSFGVLIALDFISRRNEGLEKIIFLSPNFSPKKIASGRFFRPLLGLVGLLRFLPFSQKAGRRIDYSRYPNTGDWNIRRMQADISNTGLRTYLYGIKQAYLVDYESVLPRINVPALIIHGRHDTIFPVKTAEEMSKKIKKSQFIQIENANHILALNNFDEVSVAIEEFINLSSF